MLKCQPYILLIGIIIGGASHDAQGDTYSEPLVPSEAVGTLQGQFSVSADGAASYSLPLTVPPGRAGMQPSVSLTYSSRSGNGIVGVGWSLGAGSMIARCPRKFGRDGESRPVELTDKDNFCLDGARMVKVGDHEWRTEPDMFAKIVSNDKTSGGFGSIASWDVWTRDGRIYRYGATEDARVMAAATTMTGDFRASNRRDYYKWALSRVEDRSGNYITYRYKRTPPPSDSFTDLEWLLERIDYTGSSATESAPTRSVNFEYEARPDVSFAFFSGMKVHSTRRLVRVSMNAPNPWAPTRPLVRQYELRYELGKLSGRSRLAAVTECDAGSRCLPPLTFSYTDTKPSFRRSAQGSASGLYRGNELIITDIDGDGRDDLVYPDWERRSVVIRKSNGSGFDPVSAVPDPSVQGLASLSAFDVNGDDKVDLLATYEPERNSSDAKRKLFNSRGDRFVDLNWSRWNSHLGADAEVIFGDLNGDMAVDVLVRDKDKWRLRGGIEVEDLFASPQYLALERCGRPRPGFPPITRCAPRPDVRLMDIDGDAISDLLVPHASEVQGVAWDVMHVRGGLLEAQSTNLKGELPGFADVNGDGLPDLVELRGPGSVRFNVDGALFSDPVQLFRTQPGLPLSSASESGDRGDRFVDYNQDGRPDVLILGKTGPGPEPARVLISTGTTFVSQALDDVPLSGRWDVRVKADDPTYARTLDVNGDGLFDILQWNNGNWELFIQQGSQVDLLERVEDGLGALVRRVTYTPLSQTGYKRPDRGSNAGRSYLGPISVVTQEFVANPTSSGTQPADGKAEQLAFTHEYEGGRFDTQGEGWLSFVTHTVMEKRSRAEIGTRTTYDQSRSVVAGVSRFPFKGMPLESLSWVRLADGTVKATRVKNVYKALEVPRPDGVKLYFVRTMETRTEEYESPEFDPQNPDRPNGPRPFRSASTSHTFDGFGNNAKTFVGRDSLSDPAQQVFTSTKRTFINDTTNWLIGLLANEVVTATAGNAKETRETSYVYEQDGTGRLRDIIREPNGGADAKRCTHIARRNVFGAATRIEVTPGGCAATADTRATETKYDEKEGMFVVESKNALGQTTSRKVHPGLGVEYSVTDENGLTTTRRYDRFGRLRLTKKPDGTATAVNYEFCAVNGIPYGMCINTSSSDRNFTGIRVDKLGQEVRKVSLGFKGQLSNVDSRYDNRGRLAEVSRPYFEGATQKFRAAQNEYDNANRITSSCRDKGKCQKTEYRALTVRSFDEDGNLQTTLMNQSGTIASTSIFPSGEKGQALTTTFSYGPFDTLMSVRDANGNTVTQQFDRLGRRVELNDGDIGQRRWNWNAFDEIVKETQADGKSIAMQYDKLGRLLNRSASDGIDSFTYDSGTGKGVGALARGARVVTPSAMSAASTVIEALSYDSFGRIATRTWNVNNVPFAIDYSHDAQGRLSTITYPAVPGMNRFSVKNEYGPGGFLTAVRSGSDGAPLWSADAFDAEGRVNSEILGTAVRNSYSFTGSDGTLTGIQAGKLAGPGANGSIFNEAYTYSGGGNVLSRSDLSRNLTETFTYDQANRLRTATVAGRPAVTWDYDAIGNLVAASDLGCTLSHGEQRPFDPRRLGPHALTTVKCGTVTASLRYDANGNVIENEFYAGGGGAQKATYTSFGKLLSVTMPIRGGTASTQEQFEYNAAHERVQKNVVRGSLPTVTYIGGLFEARQAPDGKTTDYVFYLPAGGKVVGEHIWRWNGQKGTAERRYFHRDRLGSVIATTDASGEVKERMSFDAFGARRNLDWTPEGKGWGAAAPTDTKVSYTGHNADDENLMIDMGARPYSPALRHFLVPDTVVQAPTYGPSWNRYSYVFNNPLRYTDPTGHAAIGRDVCVLCLGGFLSGMINDTNLSMIGFFLSSDGRAVGAQTAFEAGEARYDSMVSNSIADARLRRSISQQVDLARENGALLTDRQVQGALARAARGHLKVLCRDEDCPLPGSGPADGDSLSLIGFGGTRRNARTRKPSYGSGSASEFDQPLTDLDSLAQSLTKYLTVGALLAPLPPMTSGWGRFVADTPFRFLALAGLAAFSGGLQMGRVIDRYTGASDSMLLPVFEREREAQQFEFETALLNFRLTLHRFRNDAQRERELQEIQRQIDEMQSGQP